jgi:hypothetical protein
MLLPDEIVDSWTSFSAAGVLGSDLPTSSSSSRAVSSASSKRRRSSTPDFGDLSTLDADMNKTPKAATRKTKSKGNSNSHIDHPLTEPHLTQNPAQMLLPSRRLSISRRVMEKPGYSQQALPRRLRPCPIKPAKALHANFRSWRSSDRSSTGRAKKRWSWRAWTRTPKSALPSFSPCCFDRF